VAAAREWLAEILVDGPSGLRLLPFERVSVTRDGATIRLHMSLLPAICGAGRTTDFSFQV